MSRTATEHSETSVELAVSLDELTRLREFCRQALESCGDPDLVEQRLGSFQLAATEAVTNVIRHGFDEPADQQILCRTKQDAETLVLEIIHHGKPFEPESIPQIDQPLEGGMGLYLIEQCVDKVTYQQLPDGRQCTQLVINLT